MIRKNTVGIGYGFVHFSVEVASFYFLFARISEDPRWWLLALLFDAVAFIPQSMIGILTDTHPKFPIGMFGGILMICALLLPIDFISLMLIGLGNACIHVSGAQHTLRATAGKITPSAIFVGAGSFGVITGQLLGGLKMPWIGIVPLLLMAVSVILMIGIRKRDPLEEQIAELSVASHMDISLLVLCAFVGVTVRGYIAYAVPTEWNKTLVQGVMLFVCMGLGKMLGGILADKIGFRWVTGISLLGGLPFLLFGNSVMWLSLMGVALFSMTMPVTVAILASAFPKQPGYAFGITTVGLFMGTAPAFFVRPQTLPAHQILVIVLTVVALPAIYVCIKKGR